MASFYELAEELYREWRDEERWGRFIEREGLASAFPESRWLGLQYLPEPYLPYGPSDEVVLLTANPGGGEPQQLRGSELLSNASTYGEAVGHLTRFYMCMKNPAGRRASTMMSLCPGGFVQAEMCPFHSKRWPTKDRYPYILKSNTWLAEYNRALRAYLCERKVVCIHTMRQAGRTMKREADGYPRLLQRTLGLDRSLLTTIYANNDLHSSTQAVMTGDESRHVKVFYSVVGNNNLPKRGSPAYTAIANQLA